MNDEPASAIAVPDARGPVVALAVIGAARATSEAWLQIAVEAAAARDEITAVLAAGAALPEALADLGRVRSTLMWMQQRIETEAAGPCDPAALDAALAALRSIDEAHGLVVAALDSWTAA